MELHRHDVIISAVQTMTSSNVMTIFGIGQ